jgi:tRNA threonylcarbamoyladenosine biosynthesis protein TsaE
MKWTIHNLEETKQVAEQFLEYVGEHTLFALYGPMGVGKTTFVKAIGDCLGVEDDITSPTFAIVNEYLTAKGDSIYHFDFYRLNEASEAFDFGCEEYFYSGCRCFMEWPEKIEELLPDDVVNCYFSENEDGSRELTICI